MNTPAHLIVGLAAFGKPGNRGVTTAALIGSVAPDISFLVMTGWSIYVKGVPANTIFREYYFSPEWQQVFAVDNSLVLWGIVLLAAIWAKWPVLVALSGAGLVHIIFDFLLHNDDARMNFWPVSDWIFNSPFSYWDVRFHAGIISPLEVLFSIILCGVLATRYRSFWSRVGIFLLATSEVIAAGHFRWFM